MNKKYKNLISVFYTFFPVVLILIVGLTVLFWRLSYIPLHDWDEAIYGTVARSFFSTGDWLTLHFNNYSWFEKPPLQMWLTAGSYKIFGFNELATRFVPALAAMGLAYLVYFLGKRIASWRVGLLGALILLSSPQFIDISRQGMLDTLLTCFVYLSLFFVIKLLDVGRSKLWILVWLFIGLAVMTKGAAVVPYLGILALIIMFNRSLWSFWRDKYFWIGVGVATLVAVPWHAWMYHLYGAEFYNTYIGYHVIQRAEEAIEGHFSSYLFYIKAMISGFRPWLWLFPFALLNIVFLRGKRLKLILPVIMVSCGTFLFYEFAVQSKLGQYILPFYPGAALIVAMLFETLWEKWKSNFGRIVVVLVSISLFLMGIRYLKPLFIIRDGEAAEDKEIALAVNKIGVPQGQLLAGPGIYWDPSKRFYGDQFFDIAREPAVLREYLNTHQAGYLILGRSQLYLFEEEYLLNILYQTEHYAYVEVKFK